jgi:STE24 endopeptidase
MYLYTILAFAFLFWRADQVWSWEVVADDDVLWTLLIALLQPPLFGLLAVLGARRTRTLLRRNPDTPQVAQLFHHRATMGLRLAVALGFGATIYLTRWVAWFDMRTTSPALQIFGDLVVLSPFFASAVALWIGIFPLERDMRRESLAAGPVIGNGRPSSRDWRLWSYLDFNVRHHILIVAVPMVLILFAFNMTSGYEDSLREITDWEWTPDVLLGVIALGVFVIAPLLLKRIWHTRPLEPGPLRDRLQSVCRRIGLRCRDILVWKSDGMMINAAVMGVFRPVRYVLLSDGLLESMTAPEVEAVFGHEAGHVRRHHIQHFLVFAYVGWLTAVGIMELLLRIIQPASRDPQLSLYAIQSIGVGVTVILWGLVFGWISRRFERQADVFGARCVTPSPQDCRLPCSVHLGSADFSAEQGRLCASGAALFGSALDRVALFNGIPHEERSWRHSSIESRIRFLASLSGDPLLARRFERLIRRIKSTIVLLAVAGSALALLYCLYWTDTPALMQWVLDSVPPSAV